MATEKDRRGRAADAAATNRRADGATEQDAAVTVEGLSKSFDDADGRVLDGVDLTVREGETMVLLGPNGSGKTVLLSCIAGGLRQYSGSMSVFGEHPTDVRERFSLLLQGDMAIPKLSGREVASFFTDLHPRATDGWETITERLGLGDDLDRRVQDYSGGMVRKLELALALSVDVPLYLLDEPTAALDLTTVERFQGMLDERAADGRTVVLSSHRPTDVDVADRVAFVRDGRIVTTGDPASLMAAVPQVVRVDGTGRELSEYVRDGRFFEADDQRRAFLAEGVDPDEIDASAATAAVEVVDPRVTDLFNYYVHVADLDH